MGHPLLTDRPGRPVSREEFLSQIDSQVEAWVVLLQHRADVTTPDLVNKLLSVAVGSGRSREEIYAYYTATVLMKLVAERIG